MDKKPIRSHTFIDATFGEGQILNSPCAGEFRVNYPCITLKNESDLELPSRFCSRCKTYFFVIGVDIAEGLVELIARKARYCPSCGIEMIDKGENADGTR